MSFLGVRGTSWGDHVLSVLLDICPQVTALLLAVEEADSSHLQRRMQEGSSRLFASVISAANMADRAPRRALGHLQMESHVCFGIRGFGP